MKCVKKENGEIVRVSNEQADKLVKEKKAIFINKKEWKEQGRKR
jgi:hypothetical protein